MLSFWCVVLSLHSSSRNGMEQGRTSLLGVIRVVIEKNGRTQKVPQSAVIPGTSGACWMLMVVSLGGRKPKPRPLPMLLGHYVLHWWAMKKYKRGQMSAMTANLLRLIIWWKRHQFLSGISSLLVILVFIPSKKYWKLWKALKVARSPKPDSANSLSTQFTAA